MKTLIVGSGMAGATLALTLWEAGQDVMLVGKVLPYAASPVAAGVFNPLTGKRLQKTWLAEELFPFLAETYPRWEQLLGARFYYALPNVRPLYTLQERLEAEKLAANPQLSPWLQVQDQVAGLAHGLARLPHGAIVVARAGFVEVPAFIEAVCAFMTVQGRYQERLVESAEIALTPGGLAWQGVAYDRVIFCQGRQALGNPLTPGLPLAPLKGEILQVRPLVPETLPCVLNRNGYLAPRPDGAWWAGATYAHHFEHEGPTQANRDDLEEKAMRIGKVEVEVIAHLAGIRPSVRDRRPLLGFYREQPQVGVFNGLGTKGVSLAPYLARHFVRHMLGQEPLMPEVSLERAGL